jgi:cob(I)alamin adenosyltransferase
MQNPAGRAGRTVDLADDDKRFAEPRLAINRIYTRRGDRGETGLVGGQRLPKDALRIEAYGTVDELNSAMGLALVSAGQLHSDTELAALTRSIRRVQHELFNLGSLLATRPEEVGDKQPRVTAVEVGRLEREIDRITAELPPLRSFVLPGGSRLSAELHQCRTICRRAERICVRLLRAEPETDQTAVTYLNRLSDALFVWSRWADVQQGVAEALWDPNIFTEEQS